MSLLLLFNHAAQASGDASVNIAGVFGLSAIGSITEEGDATILLSGNSGQSGIEGSGSGDGNIFSSGIGGVSQIGYVTEEGDASISIYLSGQGSVEATAEGDASITISGVSGQSGVQGTATSTIQGASGVSGIGSFTVVGDANVTLEEAVGFSGIGAITFPSPAPSPTPMPSIPPRPAGWGGGWGFQSDDDDDLDLKEGVVYLSVVINENTYKKKVKKIHAEVWTHSHSTVLLEQSSQHIESCPQCHGSGYVKKKPRLRITEVLIG